MKILLIAKPGVLFSRSLINLVNIFPLSGGTKGDKNDQQKRPSVLFCKFTFSILCFNISSALL